MPRPRPPYLIREKNRHGNWRWYFRRKGSPRVRLPDEFGTAEFWQAYNAALEGKQVQKRFGGVSGTFEWLVRRYKSSAHYAALAPSTRLARDGIYRRVVEKSGDIDYRRFDRRKIQDAIDKRAATPHAANNFLVAMSVLFDWAVTSEYVRVNPCAGIEPIRAAIVGHHTWTMEEVEAFRSRHAVGTRQRLALELMLFSGLRASDAVLVGRQHVRDGILSISTRKTGVTITVPLAPDLRRAMEATPTGDLTYLVTERGRPFSAHGFSAWFKQACVSAGLPHCSAHGLRKAGATLAADDGASTHELMAMYGWSRTAMAEIYTKAADRKRLARAAAERIANAAVSNPNSRCGPQREKAIVNKPIESG